MQQNCSHLGLLLFSNILGKDIHTDGDLSKWLPNAIAIWRTPKSTFISTILDLGESSTEGISAVQLLVWAAATFSSISTTFIQSLKCSSSFLLHIPRHHEQTNTHAAVFTLPVTNHLSIIAATKSKDSSTFSCSLPSVRNFFAH